MIKSEFTLTDDQGLSNKPSESYPGGHKVWWTLYQGDRQASLLLGLPYCVVDAHYGISVEERLADKSMEPFNFSQACNVVIGAFLDSRLGHSNRPSPGMLDNLNDLMNLIHKSRSREWWTLPPKSLSASESLERLLQQTSFLNLKMYIHLPLLLWHGGCKEGAIACTTAAEQLLERAIRLREGSRTARLFDCKTLDFTAFVAAIVVLLGPLNRKRSSLVKALTDQFKLETSETNGQAATQFAETLSSLYQKSEEKEPENDQYTVKLPYFGVVIRNPGNRKQPTFSVTRLDDPQTAHSLIPYSNMSADSPQVTESDLASDPAWVDTGTTEAFWQMLDMDSFSFDDVFPWLDQNFDFDTV
jgi:hypothetical protein